MLRFLKNKMISNSTFISIRHPKMLFLLLWLFGSSYLDTIKPCLCSKDLNAKCMKAERDALLTFKQGLTDPSGSLSSWVGDDCCKWRGVGCDNRTGHVVNLDLGIDPRYYTTESELGGQIPRFLGNLCKLEYLDLSGNNLSGVINEVLDGFSNCSVNGLVSLNLSNNQLVGNLPDSLGRLKNLRYLELGGNYFCGLIPESIGNLSSLQELDLSYNQMNGTIPQSIGQLSQLVLLSLESNSWEGVLTEAHFLNLTRLEVLWIDTTFKKSLRFIMSHGWIPPFRLNSIQLENCQVGPEFPVWIQSQTKLEYIVLKSAGISDIVPGDWISTLSSQVTVLDLSNNKIRGKLPQFLRFTAGPKMFIFIELNSNFLEGPLPLWFCDDCAVLRLDNNLFSGNIPPNLGEIMPNLFTLSLSSNFLNGSIPPSILKISYLKNLAVRDNQLSGTLPQIWDESMGITLGILDLANNSFSGTIPQSMGNLRGLMLLFLSDNHLEGELPSSLQNCTELIMLDLGGNNLSGRIPPWIGENLVDSLMILRLRSNKFSEEIPPQLCGLVYLHILDLAQNNLTGYVPKCLGNLTSLVYDDSSPHYPGTMSMLGEIDIWAHYVKKMMIVAKGRDLEYSSTLDFVNYIDLSQNHLNGGIPPQITSLTALGTLNLSTNHLTGSIPEKIGNLRWLETLDLSNNSLSGPIPQSVSSLTSLSHFNLSHNNLVGRIPSGNQLQTLEDSSIYEGNPLLCGVPLPKKCPGDDTSNGKTPTDAGTDGDGDDEKDSEMLWFYVGIGPGFAVGFWVVCGTLLVKKTWRYAYFQFVDDIRDWIALLIALKVAALRRKFGFEQN